MRSLIISATLLVALCADTSYGAFVQILQNRGFENANHAAQWTLVPPISTVDYTADTNFFLPGPLPAEAGHNGAWGIQIVNNGLNLAPDPEETATQIRSVSPGLYRVRSSAWARIFDNTQGNSVARFRLLVDGVPFSGTPPQLENNNLDAWTPWTKLEINPDAPIQVNSSLGVELQMVSRATNPDAQSPDPWSQIVADFFTLEADLLVPPTVTNAEYSINASSPGALTHAFVAVDDNTPTGPFVWDQLQLESYTPNYGGAGSGPLVAPTLNAGQFEWNTVGSPRGDYVWSVRATDPDNMSSTGTITVRVVAVPEPSVATILVLSLLGMVSSLRRVR